MLTFNPGWDGNTRKIEECTDVRALQRRLQAQDVKPAGVVRLAGGLPATRDRFGQSDAIS